MAGPRATLRVRDVMSPDVVTASTETPFKELVELLSGDGVSALPVLDDCGRPVGIVSEADLLPKAAKAGMEGHVLGWHGDREERAKAAALTAGEVMSSPIAMVGPDMPVAVAARMMHSRRVKRLPVIDESGELVGIVTRGDLLKVFIRPDGDLRDEVAGLLTEAAHQFGLRNLQISVTNGVVALAGEVEARSQVPELDCLVRLLDGVVGLQNDLTYRTDDRQTLDLLTS